jgi:uncharacterized Fe-S cluster-containing MiaB family protein
MIIAEEAARIFDKAAVRIRADKARLNFRYTDYTDASGAVLPDPQVRPEMIDVISAHVQTKGTAMEETVESSKPRQIDTDVLQQIQQ